MHELGLIPQESFVQPESQAEQIQEIVNKLGRLKNWNPVIPEHRVTSRTPGLDKYNKARTGWYTNLLGSIGILEMMGMISDPRISRLYRVGLRRLSGETFTPRFKNPADVWLGDKLIEAALSHLEEKGLTPVADPKNEQADLTPMPLPPIRYYGIKYISQAPRWVHSPYNTDIEDEPPENLAELTPDELEELAKKKEKESEERKEE